MWPVNMSVPNLWPGPAYNYLCHIQWKILELIHVLVYYCSIVSFGAAELIKQSIKRLIVTLGTGGSAAMSGLAATCLFLTIDKHRQSFMPHLEKLNSELRKAKTRYEIAQDEVEEKVTKTMGAKH